MMNNLSDFLLNGSGPSGEVEMLRALMSLLLSFILSQCIAWLYIYTHQGLSYSRAFVQSIILLTLIVCMAMMVIGSNIVIAFGLVGALSVIRFRNILKDTRDTAFIFFALITGMGTGTQSYLLSTIGTTVFGVVLLYLHWTKFGSRHTSDGFLRFNVQEGATRIHTIQALMRRYCRTTHLMSQRFQENGSGEVAYRVIMRDPTRGDDLVAELQEMTGITKITFVLHEEQAEV